MRIRRPDAPNRWQRWQLPLYIVFLILVVGMMIYFHLLSTRQPTPQSDQGGPAGLRAPGRHAGPAGP